MLRSTLCSKKRVCKLDCPGPKRDSEGSNGLFARKCFATKIQIVACYDGHQTDSGEAHVGPGCPILESVTDGFQIFCTNRLTIARRLPTHLSTPPAIAAALSAARLSLPLLFGRFRNN